MSLTLSTRFALRALLHHSGRSLLTAIGIVVGIAGMIATHAIGTGTQKKTREELLSYGSNSIDIHPGNQFVATAAAQPKPILASYKPILQEQVSGICDIGPVIYPEPTTITHEGKTYTSRVVACMPCTMRIRDLELAQGCFFVESHNQEHQQVVVLDHHAAQTLFAWQNAIGKRIIINNIPFTVIGVLAAPRVLPRWDLGKLRCYIPFSVGHSMAKLPEDHTHSLELKACPGSDTQAISQQLTQLMRLLHQIDPQDPNDFTIWSLQEMAAAAEAGARAIGLFGLIAASIALLVGGIGVMNIMLVAVRERTKEIGIKLALGATQGVILQQFLIESVVLCLCGGILGIMLGSILSYAIERMTGLPAIITFFPTLVALVVTVLIGLVFGYYPAHKAASLNPVEALIDM